MTTIILRAIIIYVLVLIVFRIMGKRQLGQMQPFEFVLTLIIADLATIPMAEISVPLLNGIVPLLTLVVLHYLITLFTRKSIIFSKVVSGKPVIIINQNGIDITALKKLNITIDDLFEAIRGAGYFNIDEVQYAIMETNGKVSVMPKANNSPITASDIKLEKDETSLPITIISEGKFISDNVKISNKSEDFYKKILKNEKITSIKSVLLFTINKEGDIFLQEKNKPFKKLSIGNQKWKEEFA